MVPSPAANPPSMHLSSLESLGVVGGSMGGSLGDCWGGHRGVIGASVKDRWGIVGGPGSPRDTPGYPQDTPKIPQGSPGCPLDTLGYPHDTPGYSHDTPGSTARAASGPWHCDLFMRVECMIWPGCLSSNQIPYIHQFRQLRQSVGT